MSWDIFVMNVPPGVEKVEDIPSDHRPSAIKRSEIISGIIDAVPNADFSNPSWGLIDEQGWSIEVNLGDKQECGSFMLHVRGGDGAIGAVAAILRRLNLRAIDCQTGEFFAADHSAVESFGKWRKFLERCLNSTEPD